MNMQKSSNSV